jgi:hypothetical protein
MSTPRPYRIRRTLAGWMVTATATDAYVFAATHAEAIEAVAKYEVARLGGWEWWPYTTPEALLLVNSHTGQTRRFRNHQQAAVFLAALHDARKAKTS